MSRQPGTALSICAFVAICVPTFGATVYSVSFDTTSLIGHPASPYYVQLTYTDGSGIDDANNTVTISNVDFGGGSALGGPITFGGASGDLNTAVTMTDNSFLSLFVQEFAPGLHLNFTLSLTTNDDDGGFPDRFTFFLLDNSGVALPTLAPFGDYYFGADLGSGGPVFDVWGSDLSRTPSVGGAVAVPAPEITAAIPEPSTWLLLGSALAVVALLRHTASRRYCSEQMAGLTEEGEQR